MDIGADQYYQEMEVGDFNLLFWNQQLIEEKFGRSIRVALEVDPQTKRLSRTVKELVD